MNWPAAFTTHSCRSSSHVTLRGPQVSRSASMPGRRRLEIPIQTPSPRQSSRVLPRRASLRCRWTVALPERSTLLSSGDRQVSCTSRKWPNSVPLNKSSNRLPDRKHLMVSTHRAATVLFSNREHTWSSSKNMYIIHIYIYLCIYIHTHIYIYKYIYIYKHYTYTGLSQKIRILW